MFTRYSSEKAGLKRIIYIRVQWWGPVFKYKFGSGQDAYATG